MKFKINLITIISVLSVLVFSLTGCEDDNLTNEKNNINTSYYIEKSNQDNVDEIISSLDYTLNKALKSNNEYTQEELSDIFIDELENKNVETVVFDENHMNPEFSADYNMISNQIVASKEYNSPQSYKDMLNDLKSNLNQYDLTTNERLLMKDNIKFMHRFVLWMEEVDRVHSPDIETKCTICDFWNDWGECIVGVVGGAITGATIGCGAIGSVGGTIGAGICGPACAGAGAIAGYLGGAIVGGIAGGLNGAADHCF
jgi:hypothetical protein